MARFTSCLVAAALLLCAVSATKPHLGEVRLNLRSDTVTVSGISAGAFMAVQYETAFSSQVKGAGVIAGGPYLCAMGSLMGATECMYEPSMLSQDTLVSALRAAAAENNIDDPSNMKNHTVFLFSGVLDSLVAPATMALLDKIYGALGVMNVTTFFDVLAEHAWITDDFGSACTTLSSPYINNCGLDFAGQFLRAAFTNLGVSWNSKKGTTNSASIYRFNAATYGANAFINSLATTSVIYLPERCRKGHLCHLHVSFHGCEQNLANIGNTFVRHSEIDQWAEANDIVVLYPQADANTLKENPNACFDWWGYNGADYAFRTGAQLSIINTIVNTMLNGTLPPPSTEPTSAPTATCAGKPDGSTCVTATEYIECPVGLTFNCYAGLTCTGLPGLAMCL